MHRWISGLAVVVGLVMLACNDRTTPASITAPRLAAKPVAAACNFTALGPLANKYFPTSTEKNIVKGIINAMQTAGAFATEAQDSGFSVLAHVAANVDAGNPDSTDASTLANGVLACMYSDPAALPATFPEDFLTPTDANASGAFQVRGSAADNLTAPVYNRPYSAPFSMVAAPTSIFSLRSAATGTILKAPSSVAFSSAHSKRSNFTTEIKRVDRRRGARVGTGSTRVKSTAACRNPTGWSELSSLPSGWSASTCRTFSRKFLTGRS